MAVLLIKTAMASLFVPHIQAVESKTVPLLFQRCSLNSHPGQLHLPYKDCQPTVQAQHASRLTALVTLPGQCRSRYIYLM